MTKKTPFRVREPVNRTVEGTLSTNSVSPDEWANHADTGKSASDIAKAKAEKPWDGLDPNAPRHKRYNAKAKSINIGFNEYEYARLKAAADSGQWGVSTYLRRIIEEAVEARLAALSSTKQH